MKKQRYIYLIAAVLVLFLVISWHHVHPETTVLNEKTAPNINTPVMPMASTSNSPSLIKPTNPSTLPPEITSSNLAEKYNEYRQGKIDKNQLMQEVGKEENKQPQDFYGRIIDQYGQTVIGAQIIGNLEMIPGLDDDAKPQIYRTQSDSEGLFQFTGIEGAQLDVTVGKDGYIMGARGEGYKGPIGEKTKPYDRAILTMWKLRGAEPLVSYSIDSKIPFDGTPTTFDIAAQKINLNGDLQVTLIRSPLDVRRGKDIFDWAVRVEILHGGLIEENDPYPYWAPESGYQPSFEFNMSSNNVPWHSSFEDNFYIKNSQGQYGRMKFDVYGALTPARIQFNFTINPSGSQNLEPAPDK